MQKTNAILLGLACGLIGLIAGAIIPANAESVATADVDGAWEIQSAPFGQQSFYVVKHNRITGETHILSGNKGASDDSWLLLPIKDKR